VSGAIEISARASTVEPQFATAPADQGARNGWPAEPIVVGIVLVGLYLMKVLMFA
jgi:hypothetical protein